MFNLPTFRGQTQQFIGQITDVDLMSDDVSQQANRALADFAILHDVVDDPLRRVAIKGDVLPREELGQPILGFWPRGSIWGADLVAHVIQSLLK